MCAGVLAVCILKWGSEVKVGVFITPLSFSFNLKNILLFCMHWYFCLHVPHLHVVPAEASIRYPWTGVTTGCEPLYGCR